MKSKIIISLMLLVSLVAGAKTERTNPKYLNGAVPEENGIIVFKKAFAVADKSDAEIYEAMQSYVKNSLVASAINENRTRVISEDKEGKSIVARVEEYMIFKKITLNLDRTRFRYQISVNVNNHKVTINVTQISYYYNEDMDGNNGVNYKGEEWITDKVAVNKSNTKLYPRSGKFRIKTIDRVEEIFEGAMDALVSQGDKQGQNKWERNGIQEF